MSGDVIYVSTFSKYLAPGLRLGSLVAPARLMPLFSSVKRTVDFGASPIAQATLAEFIERGYLRAHMRSVRREYRLRRDALHSALHKHLPRTCRWELPSHDVVLWLRLPEGLDPYQVYEEALAAGVLVSPSPMWSVDGAELREPALRLTFCAESPSAWPKVHAGSRKRSKPRVHALAAKRNHVRGRCTKCLREFRARSGMEHVYGHGPSDATATVVSSTASKRATTPMSCL